MLGIDVSSNNGKIDWAKVKTNAPKVNFAYIKASEGVGFIDASCASEAKKAGMKIGYYHFASLNTHDVTHDATDEANWFTKKLKELPPAALPPVLDIEENPVRYTDSAKKFVKKEIALDSNEKLKAGFTIVPPLSPVEVMQWIRTFLAVMKQNGFADIVIYSYTPFLNSNLPHGHGFQNKLWLAQYTKAPAPNLPSGWVNYWLWQYTNQGRINGFAGNVDCNAPPKNIETLI